MKFYLMSRTAIARALAAGKTVWCASTEEGFELHCRSFRHAKQAAKRIMHWTNSTLFYIE